MSTIVEFVLKEAVVTVGSGRKILPSCPEIGALPRSSTTPFATVRVRGSPCVKEVDNRVNLPFFQGKSLLKGCGSDGDNRDRDAVQDRCAREGVDGLVIGQDVRIDPRPLGRHP